MDHTTYSVADVERTLKLLHGGGLFEVRILFDDHRESIFTYDAAAVAEYIPELESQKPKVVYTTLNPLIPERFEAIKKDHVLRHGGGTFVRGANDWDVIRRYTMLIDFDPDRDPSDAPSTWVEKEAAWEVLEECRAWLRDEGFPDPMIGDSANGYHLNYRVDLPNDYDSATLVKLVLDGIAAKFPPAGPYPVKIDPRVFNAGRLTKVYGTTSRKGRASAERPHRVSCLLEVPSRWDVVDMDVLSRVAADPPEDTPPKKSTRIKPGEPMDLPEWLAKKGIVVGKGRRALIHNEWATSYDFETCPYMEHEGSQGNVFQWDSGKLGAHCYHERCKNFNWYALREILEPNRKAYIK